MIPPAFREDLDAQTDFYKLRESLLSCLLAVLHPGRDDAETLTDARELVAIYNAHPAHVAIRDRIREAS